MSKHENDPELSITDLTFIPKENTGGRIESVALGLGLGLVYHRLHDGSIIIIQWRVVLRLR